MASQAMVSRVVMVYTLLISEAIQDRVPEMKDPQPEPPIYRSLFTAILKRALTRGFAGRNVACA